MLKKIVDIRLNVDEIYLRVLENGRWVKVTEEWDEKFCEDLRYYLNKSHPTYEDELFQTSLPLISDKTKKED